MVRLKVLVDRLKQAEADVRAYLAGQAAAKGKKSGDAAAPEPGLDRPILSEASLRLNAEMQIPILNALPAHVALLDADGVILIVNESWERFAAANGLQSPSFGIGSNYVEVCERSVGDCSEEAGDVARGLRRVLRDEMSEFTLEYPCHSPTEKRWFRVVVCPVSRERLAGAVVMHVNITALRIAEEDLRQSEQEQRLLTRQLQAETARLIAAQSIAKVGSWETDLRTLEVQWSAETHRILETDPATYASTHAGFLERVHPDDRKAVDDAFRRSMNLGGSHAIEHRCLVGGRIKFIDERWQIQHDESGQAISAIGTCQDITDRKVGEHRVVEAQRFSQMLIETSPLAIIAYRGSGEGILANAASARILGAPSVAHVRATNFRQLEGWRDTGLLEAADDALNSGELRELEIHTRNSFGKEVWLHCRLIPLTYYGGERYLFCWLEDIEERKRAEEERDRLFTLSLDMLAVAGFDGWFLQLNPAWTECLGWTVEELKSRPILEFVHPDDHLATVGSRQRIQEGHSSRGFENRYRCKDGSYRWLSWSVHPLMALKQVFAVVRDVTAVRQSQAALQSSERRHRLLFAASPLPMWVFDRETFRFLAVNEAAVQHYGYSESEFLTMDVRAIRPPDEAARLERHLREFADQGKETGLWRHRKKDGTLIDVEVSSDNLEYEGRTVRLILANDVTERVRAEQDAARSTRALRMLSRCNEALIRAGSEKQLLIDVCKIATEVGGFASTWVGYVLDDQPRSIVPQAHAGADNGYMAAVELPEPQLDVEGPVARAIRSMMPVVVLDVSEPGAVDRFALDSIGRDSHSVVCLPLKAEGVVIGVLVLHSGGIRAVSDEELTLLQEMADNLAFGISNLRERRERRRTDEAVLAMARGISAATGAEFFEKLARSLVEVLGAHAGCIAEINPDEPATARTLCVVAGGQTRPNFEYSMAGRPCAELERNDPYVVPRDAQKQYPQINDFDGAAIAAYGGTRLLDAKNRTIGVMFVQFQEALDRPKFVASTLKIFASRAAAELERQNVDAKTREQAALIDQARDAIVVRDMEHRISFWSRGAERLYGWSAEESVGRDMRELLRPEAAVYDEAERLMRETGEWNGELKKVTRSGRLLTLEARWTLLRDTEGRPKSILSLDTDVTDRKALEQQFLRAQRMESIGTLAGGIAHDLNNLLAPITIGVELLRQFEPSPRSLSVIDSMQRSAQRGADLVGQVLSFVRGVQGERVVMQAGHIIREVQSIARNTFPKNITLETTVQSDLWPIVGDPTQINQVLLNLCVNARDAMPQGGQLEILATNVEIDEQYAVMNRNVTAGPYVRIQVTDSGCGMSREVADRIFEPFFTTKELGKGTGLGLSTVLGILRSHGGFVNVYSEPGKGSTFKVHLPARTDGAASVVETPESTLPRGNGELVLIVDDETTILEVTGQTLETFGYRVITAEDGAEAISLYAIHRNEVAVVLTDMMMPVMDGPVLIAALRRINPAVRLIAASGLNINAHMARAAGAGAVHFLAKPYSAEVMLKMLKKILQEGAAGGSRPPL